MIRTKGEAGTGNVIEAVKHIRELNDGIRHVSSLIDEELLAASKDYLAPIETLKSIRELKKLPVVNFAAGGIATPADAALMMQLGCEGVFVGSGIFKSNNPKERAIAIVQATTHFKNADILKEISRNIGDAMPGINIDKLSDIDKLSKRGW